MYFDYFIQDWNVSCSSSSKLQFYSQFKKIFGFCEYLNFIKEAKYRIALTKLRICSHSLAIEAGRYTGDSLSHRLCKLCKMNVVEDEFHFLLVCPVYRDLRLKYLDKYFCHWPNKYKFFYLLSCSYSKPKVIKLSKYIFFSLKKRDSLL